MAVLDTSALLFWIFDRPKLTAPAQAAIDKANHLYISSISIWEIGLKTDKGKLSIPLTAGEMVTRLKLIERVEILPVDEEIWLHSIDLDWPHRDPADRAIVALAQYHDDLLITSDGEMRKYYAKAVW